MNSSDESDTFWQETKHILREMEKLAYTHTHIADDVRNESV